VLRRLVVIYLLLMGLVLLALEIPLGLVLVNRDTQQVATDRLADATRFASIAGPALRTDEATAVKEVEDEFVRYQELYDIRVAVLNRERTVVTSSSPSTLDDEALSAVHEALTGRPISSYETVWPWHGKPLVTAVPVTNGGEVLGAVVTVSPTGRLRERVRAIWLALGGIGLFAVAACVVTAFGLARWVIKPVTELGTTTHRIAAGHHTARVPHRTGPPELRRLAVSFNEMADIVTDALERQRSFVAHASHQLRNPLTALRLRVEELGHELTTDEARTEHEIALAETDRFAHVLEGLLALARAERGKHQLDTVDAVAVARSRVVAWRPLADRRGIALSLRPATGPLPVNAVSTALDQALDTLIDNALKFTPETGRVVLSVAAEDGGASVHVVDTGPGLSEEQRRRATEPFWRAPDAQNIDGSGLGLPIAVVLIEVSGGRIDLLSAPEGGLDARVWLPAPPQPTPPDTSTADTDAHAPPVDAGVDTPVKVTTS
jgi:signal transduction histidine kinase